MSSKTKQKREITKELAGLGIEVIDIQQRRNHYKWFLRNRHGVCTKYTMPISASCRRASLNRMADMKRFARRTA